MANKSVPVNLKLLKGSYNSTRDGAIKDLPKFDKSAPVAPSFIKGSALKEWKRVSKILESVGVLNALDMSVLTQYCLLWQELELSVIGGEDGEKFTAAQHTQLRLCAAELGITAVSRGKVSKDSESKKNKFQ